MQVRGWQWLLLLAVGMLMVGGACRPQASQQQPAPTPSATEALATPTTVPAPPSPTATPDANIVVTVPVNGTQVANPVRVTGRARVFEGALVVAVLDAQGKELVRESVQASAGAPEWGNFQKDVTYPAPDRQAQGRVEVFSLSPRDGAVMNRVVIPVVLAARSPGNAAPVATATSPQR